MRLSIYGNNRQQNTKLVRGILLLKPLIKKTDSAVRSKGDFYGEIRDKPGLEMPTEGEYIRRSVIF